ncbi:MAG: Biotin transporter BioY [Chlamydiales bacterium]|nr:Biotin transporter BioY [Chlamydiales bacterium]MCH9636026.1 Biotin transporter BioY [Chlamydiales bacterium]MCH9703598.1 biotin transporter BioY [Chlamydiota bacterium]
MTVLVDLVRPKSRNLALAFDALAVVGGSLFLGLMAQIALPLWFTPVPLSLFTVGVLLLGAGLGSKRGALAVLAYLLEGSIGLPMFAHMTSGAAVLLGITGGYLFASVPAAFVVGYLLERGWNSKYGLTALALLVGSAMILGFGTLWLSYFLGFKGALVCGFYPFVVGDLLKVVATATLLPTIWRVCKR